jgi:CheY-like chemotaxis protein
MKQTIFVVDDSATNIAMAEQVLAGKYNVISLTSAQQMFDALSSHKPNLILLDIEMPEMNGIDAMAKLDESEEWEDIPVVFFTGHTDNEYISKALETGARDIVIKPYDAKVLLKIVSQNIS